MSVTNSMLNNKDKIWCRSSITKISLQSSLYRPNLHMMPSIRHTSAKPNMTQCHFRHRSMLTEKIYTMALLSQSSAPLPWNFQWSYYLDQMNYTNLIVIHYTICTCWHVLISICTINSIAQLTKQSCNALSNVSFASLSHNQSMCECVNHHQGTSKCTTQSMTEK